MPQNYSFGKMLLLLGTEKTIQLKK